MSGTIRLANLREVRSSDRENRARGVATFAIIVGLLKHNAWTQPVSRRTLRASGMVGAVVTVLPYRLDLTLNLTFFRPWAAVLLKRTQLASISGFMVRTNVCGNRERMG